MILKYDKKNYSLLIIISLILYGLIFVSPVWRWILPLSNGIYLLLIVLTLTASHVMRRRKIKKIYIIAASALLIMSLVSGIYWQELVIGIYPSFFLIGLWVLSVSKYKDILYFIRFSSWLMVLLITGAWIGFFYALQGGEAIFTLENPDGRANSFYLSTLSNVHILNYIRPSGIYDEPGTFSFLVCGISLVRHQLSLDKRMTWFLLISGLVTTSLAHVAYTIFHFLAEDVRIGKVVAVAVSGVLVVCIAGQTEIGSAFDRLLLTRFEVENGKLRGDNRSDSMIAAADHLSTSTFFFGLDESATTNSEEFKSKYPEVGSAHPVAPLVRQGILLVTGYYVVLILLLVKGLTERKMLVLVGLAALFAQRPYITSMGYALWAILPLMLAYGRWKSQVNKA